MRWAAEAGANVSALVSEGAPTFSAEVARGALFHWKMKLPFPKVLCWFVLGLVG